MIPATSKCEQLESSIAPALITVGLVANDVFTDGLHLIDPLNAESGLFCLFEILEVNIMIAARGAR